MEQDRRKNKDRRQLTDRRKSDERRQDFRLSGPPKRRTIRVWLRSFTNARLGVDRRKEERRGQIDRRQKNIHSILTQDEISDLLNL